MSNRELGTNEALLIAGSICGLLIAMLVLRYLFDITFVCVFERRNPCPRRRITSEEDQETPTQSQNAASICFPSEERMKILEQVLDTRVLSAEDLADLKQSSSRKDDDGQAGTKVAEDVVCSICLDPLEVGDVVASSKCGHVFHRTHLLQWLKNSSVCPYCRANILHDDSQV